MSNQPPSRDVEIGKHSRITLGVLWAILAVAVASAITGVGMYDKVCNKLDELQKSQCTKDSLMRFSAELQRRNKQLDVPIPTWDSDQADPPAIASQPRHLSDYEH